jgi:DMSO/TMAO reductase YedYZ molybdopterin-dependent catalytic subunit
MLLSASGLSLRGGEFNVTSPLQSIRGAITPAELFFVRNHFAEPDLSLRNWTLQIGGRVARPLELDFSDLLEWPSVKLEAVLECAGNPASGSAVSNGIWEGVSLASLLERARPEAGAKYALLEGADSGSLSLGSKVLPYSQIVPFSKCHDENSLVAYKLNSRFLPRRNGFPARALLPGWYAMDSVKWLRRIVLLESEAEATQFYASGMDRYYVRLLQAADGLRRGDRVSEILVKSVVAYPKDGARLPAGEHSVWGFAWTGSGAIQSIELSVDGGQNWGQTTLESQSKPLAWTRWSYRWKAAPGEYKLVSRARDRAGREQPLLREPARGDGYELNWCAPVNCSVR